MWKKSITYYNVYIPALGGRDSSVGIATRYGLDGPGIEPRWEERFSVPIQTGPGTHPASYRMGTLSFLRVKRPGRGVDHPLPSSDEVEGRVELYNCSPSGPLWPVLGRIRIVCNLCPWCPWRWQCGWPKHGWIHCVCKDFIDQHLYSIQRIVEHILITAPARFDLH